MTGSSSSSSSNHTTPPLLGTKSVRIDTTLNNVRGCASTEESIPTRIAFILDSKYLLDALDTYVYLNIEGQDKDVTNNNDDNNAFNELKISVDGYMEHTDEPNQQAAIEIFQKYVFGMGFTRADTTAEVIRLDNEKEYKLLLFLSALENTILELELYDNNDKSYEDDECSAEAVLEGDRSAQGSDKASLACELPTVFSLSSVLLDLSQDIYVTLDTLFNNELVYQVYFKRFVDEDGCINEMTYGDKADIILQWLSSARIERKDKEDIIFRLAPAYSEHKHFIYLQRYGLEHRINELFENKLLNSRSEKDKLTTIQNKVIQKPKSKKPSPVKEMLSHVYINASGKVTKSISPDLESQRITPPPKHCVPS